MDDLLTAFQAEISQDLDACAADFDRLRRSPADTAAVAKLHKVLCSIREMSVVLGQQRLSELASRGVGALESARAGMPGATESAVPIVAECLEQIRSAVRYLPQTGSDALPTPARIESRQNGTEVATAPRSPAVAGAAEPPRRPRAAKRRWYRPRNLLLAGGASVVAAGAAAAIVLLSADLDDYRSVFEETIRTATGRQVTIGGVELALSFSPTVVLEDVVFANAVWGSRPHMAKAERVEVEMALLPLLRGEFEAKRFILRGADILLETDSGGHGNWELGPDDGSAQPVGDSEATTLPQLARLTIEDSTLSYRDGTTGETETFVLTRVIARQAGQQPLVDIDVNTVVNGQPISFAGTVGRLDLLQGPASYPVDLAGEVAGLKVTVKGDVTEPLKGRGYSLAVTASGQSLAGLGSMLATDLPPGSPVQLTAVLDDPHNTIRIRDIGAQIGRSDASGEIVLEPGEPHWRIDANLAANQINLDDFISAENATESVPDDPRLFSSAPLPYRWMGKIDIVGTLAADRVVYGDASMTAASLEGVIKAGRLTLDRLQFGYAGGEVALKASGDVNTAAPVWTLQGSGRRLAGGETLERLFGLSMVSGGQADVDVNVAASGRSLREIAMTLDGGAGLSLTNGRIDDDLMRLFLTDLTRAASLRGGSAQLRCLTAMYDFKDGNGRARTFVADAGAAVVVGAGTVSLRNETIDMDFQPAAKDVSLAALAVPVHVTGPLANPDVTPDPVGVATSVPRAAVSLADAALGLVGGENVLDTTPTGSCTAIAASTAGATSKAAKKKNSGTTKQATTEQKKQKKQKKASATEEFLDDAGRVIDDIGTGIGNLFE